MYRIALNTAISGFRKKQIAKTELDQQAYKIPEAVDPKQDEELQWLYTSIESLSDIEKAIVLLYLEDKPYEEIAEVTGITANYVAVKMNRIKEKLRKLVKTTEHGRIG
jgi:RNA polymerase sigma-70 factor (ECF subfamily)